MFNGRRRWTKQEDQSLREYVNLYGEKAWQEVCKFIPGRRAKQCRERWLIYLSPKIRKEDFTDAEDDLLRALVELYGKKWTKISHMFVGRAPETLKTRYATLIRREKAEKKRQEKNAETRQDFANHLQEMIFGKFEPIDLTKEEE